MAWTVKYAKPLRKVVKGLSSEDRRRVRDFIDNRLATSEEPRRLGRKLAGSRFGDAYRFRVGQVRIIAEIRDAELVILVVRIAQRGGVYG